MKEGVHQIVLQFKDETTSRDNDFALLDKKTEEEIEWTGWLELNPSIGAMLDYMNAGTRVIGFILFILISLGVINSLFMSIYERTYEFGVLKRYWHWSLGDISLVLFRGSVSWRHKCSDWIGCWVCCKLLFQSERSPAWRNGILWGNVWKRQFIYRTGKRSVHLFTAVCNFVNVDYIHLPSLFCVKN